MGKLLFDLVTDMKEKDREAQKLASLYLTDFDEMLLVEPIKSLAHPRLEMSYRGRLNAFFQEELKQFCAVPEYRNDYLRSYGLEHIDYEAKTIVIQDWQGDHCSSLSIPIYSFTKLREIQEVANDLVANINKHFLDREAREAEEKRAARRAQFLELQKEFGDE